VAPQVIGIEKNKLLLNNFAEDLVSWHKKNGRHNLPWQIKISPYKVWISEIMLQQTQVKTVLPYYKKFLTKYPSIKSLSNSKLDDLLELWTGLGYYRRAENIYKTSQILKNKYNYIFPKTYEDILDLPGIGKSTAGAILSIAYNKKYPILDGNVKRVIKRYFAITGKEDNVNNLWNISESVLPTNDNNIFTQSIMDLGALVCVKKNPLCDKCPLKKKCKSLKFNLTEKIPEKKQKLVKKHVNLYLLLIQKYENEKFVLMKKNPSNGIWANLWNLPSFNGVNEYKKFLLSNNLSCTSSQYDYIEHNLSHLKLKINIIKVELKKCTEVDNYCWKNIYDKIGSSKPIIMIIDKLKKEQK